MTEGTSRRPDCIRSAFVEPKTFCDDNGFNAVMKGVKTMITLEHISKLFKAEAATVAAVDDVSLHIQAGEIFGIIGFSGAGKSTLVRCVNLLERPQKGRVIIDGTDITALDAAGLRKVRQRIGMIFQHFNLMPSRTVFENIELPLKLTDLTPEARAQKVTELLELVGLSDKRDVYPSQLSGGQKQRVAIARALANDPKVLLCDEATSALDPQTTHSILQLLKEVNRRLGITLVVITHQMSVIKEICSRVAVMQHGKIVETGNVIDVFAEPQAPITKDFITAAGNLGSFYELLQTPDAVHGLDKDQAVWLLTFKGNVAGEPMMSELYRRFQVRANIIYGNIDYLGGTILGKLGIGVEGDEQAIIQAKQFLIESNVKVEVLR